MSTTQIRERFHSLIDHISDEDRLKHLYDALADADTAPQEITDELTVSQKRELEAAIAKRSTSTGIPDKEARRQIDEWLSK